MNRNRSKALVVLLGLLLCAPACRQLDPAGVYQGDQVLYEADLAIITSYDIVHTFVKWERDNEASLRKWPGIHSAAERLRVEYKGWHASALALRDVYAAQKTEENKSKLLSALSLLRTALNEATKHMAEASQPSPN